jgi:hypothetical protein
MVTPIRVTIALDKDTAELFERLKNEERASQSGLIRRALKFYAQYKDMLEGKDERINTYVDMLTEGEHLIIDLDHWLLFMKYLEDVEEFWEDHHEIARAHGEQLPGKTRTPEDLLKRLEACNFYKLKKDSDNEYTLMLGSERNIRFIKVFLEEVLEGMGYKADIKEDLTKLRVKIL